MEENLYTVYALYSDKFDKIYIGCTSNLIARFHSHNSLSKKGWTKKFRPWKVVYCEYFDEKLHALNREKELKSCQGRLFLRAMIVKGN